MGRVAKDNVHPVVVLTHIVVDTPYPCEPSCRGLSLRLVWALWPGVTKRHTVALVLLPFRVVPLLPSVPYTPLSSCSLVAPEVVAVITRVVREPCRSGRRNR